MLMACTTHCPNDDPCGYRYYQNASTCSCLLIYCFIKFIFNVVCIYLFTRINAASDPEGWVSTYRWCGTLAVAIVAVMASTWALPRLLQKQRQQTNGQPQASQASSGTPGRSVAPPVKNEVGSEHAGPHRAPGVPPG